MQKKHSILQWCSGRGYYIALAACILVLGVSALVFYRTLSGIDDGGEALSVPVTAQEPSAPKQEPAAEPPAPTTPTTQPSRVTTEIDLPVIAMQPGPSEPVICQPLEGAVIAAFSADALAYNPTMDDWRTHNGVDLAAALGDPVCAVMDGVVTAIYEDDYLGTVVRIVHDDGWSTVYANLSDSPPVNAGERVSAGQVIGRVGQSAMLEVAAPPHLHLEVRRNGVLTDPAQLLG